MSFTPFAVSGLPVDDNGWTIFTPSGTPSNGSGGTDVNSTNIIFVAPAANGGSDTNIGSDVAPVATIQKAMQLVRNGSPDWILLRKGCTWLLNSGNGGMLYASGKPHVLGSGTPTPLVIGNFDPALGFQGVNTQVNPSTGGARPLIKIAAGYEFNSFYGGGGANGGDYTAFVGLECSAYQRDWTVSSEFSAPTTFDTCANFFMQNRFNWLLFEDVWSHHFCSNFCISNSGPGTDNNTQVPDKYLYMRRCVSSDAWGNASQLYNDVSGISVGYTFDYIDQVWMEDCFAFRSGDPTALNGQNTVTVGADGNGKVLVTWPNSLGPGNHSSVYFTTSSGNIAAGGLDGTGNNNNWFNWYFVLNRDVNGANTFNISAGKVLSFGTPTSTADGVNGTYPNISLTYRSKAAGGGNPTGLVGTVIVSGGAVTSVTPTSPGLGSEPGDTVTGSFNGAPSSWYVPVATTDVVAHSTEAPSMTAVWAGTLPTKFSHNVYAQTRGGFTPSSLEVYGTPVYMRGCMFVAGASGNQSRSGVYHDNIAWVQETYSANFCVLDGDGSTRTGIIKNSTVTEGRDGTTFWQGTADKYVGFLPNGNEALSTTLLQNNIVSMCAGGPTAGQAHQPQTLNGTLGSVCTFDSEIVYKWADNQSNWATNNPAGSVTTTKCKFDSNGDKIDDYTSVSYSSTWVPTDGLTPNNPDRTLGTYATALGYSNIDDYMNAVRGMGKSATKPWNTTLLAGSFNNYVRNGFGVAPYPVSGGGSGINHGGGKALGKF